MTDRLLRNESYVRCRSLGHVWDDFAPIDMRRPSFGSRLSFRCERCGTERHDTISRVSGDLIQRAYRNRPDDYGVDRSVGEERPTAALLRARLLQIRSRRKATA